MKRILIILAALALMAGPAFAQSKPTIAAVDPLGLNKLMASPIIQALANWAPEDINAAIALSTQIEGLQDPTGGACLKSFGNLGAVVKAHPLPLTFKLATDLEAGRLFFMAIKQICTNQACTQTFTDLSNQVNALSPMPIPAPISIAAVCSKIL